MFEVLQVHGHIYEAFWSNAFYSMHLDSWKYESMTNLRSILVPGFDKISLARGGSVGSGLFTNVHIWVIFWVVELSILLRDNKNSS